LLLTAGSRAGDIAARAAPNLALIWDHAAVPSLLTACCAALLVGASAAGRVPLAIVLIVVQAGLIVGWFRSVALTGRWHLLAAAIAVAAAVAGDVALLRSRDHADVRALTAVLAALVGCAFAVQLLRRDGRARLTEALGVTVASGALSLAGAVLLGVRGGRGGVDVVAIAVAAAGVGVLAVQSKLPLGVSLPLGLVVGTGVGVLVGRHATLVGAGAAATIAVVAAAVALASRGAAVGFTTAAGVRATAVVSAVPLLVIAPAVLVVARVMVG
jgi:hypothetical protein